jgi:hypothetical protein
MDDDHAAAHVLDDPIRQRKTPNIFRLLQSVGLALMLSWSERSLNFQSRGP